jgi:hypothetical protein
MKLGIKKRREKMQYVRPDIITDNQTVITDNQTVITDNQTVITALKVIDESIFEYGDRLIKALKQDFQRESNNLRQGNGVVETIVERIEDKQAEFDEVVRNRNVRITPKLKAQICRWLENEYYPFVNRYKRPKIQLELADWREVTKLKQAA